MGAADYKKQDAVNFGHAIGNLISEVRKDGAGAEDIDEAIETLRTGAQAVNEMTDIPEAAGEHIIGATLDKMGDYAQQKAVELEAASNEPG